MEMRKMNQCGPGEDKTEEGRQEDLAKEAVSIDLGERTEQVGAPQHLGLEGRQRNMGIKVDN